MTDDGYCIAYAYPLNILLNYYTLLLCTYTLYRLVPCFTIIFILLINLYSIYRKNTDFSHGINRQNHHSPNYLNPIRELNFHTTILLYYF